MTGLSFAHDIAASLLIAPTLACSSDELGGWLQCQLTTSSLRLYGSTDSIGAELGGAIKNVIAIAYGVALMVRSYPEMQCMVLPLGAQTEILAGLS